MGDLADRPVPSVADVEVVRGLSNGGLVTGGYASPITVWSAERREVRSFGLKKHLNALDADDELVVAAYSAGPRCAGPVRAFDIRTGNRVKLAEGHSSAVLAVLLTADAIHTASADGTVRICHRRSRELASVIELPGRARAQRLAIHEGELVVASSDEVFRFDRKSGALRSTLTLQGLVGPLASDARGIMVGIDGEVHALE